MPVQFKPIEIYENDAVCTTLAKITKITSKRDDCVQDSLMMAISLSVIKRGNVFNGISHFKSLW